MEQCGYTVFGLLGLPGQHASIRLNDVKLLIKTN
jgi:hypothetical protein